MLKKYYTLIALLITLFSCNIKINIETDNDSAKEAMLNTEKQFAEMAEKKGVDKAFLYFSADQAVLNRNNKLIKGKREIREFFEKQTLRNVKLNWTPDFADVSSSGDLGYTYGHYTFSAIDTLGNEIKSEGIFHTVWKKQSDGSWKFVWD